MSCCVMQRCPTLIISYVNIHTPIDKYIHDSRVPIFCGSEMERGRAGIIPCAVSPS